MTEVIILAGGLDGIAQIIKIISILFFAGIPIVYMFVMAGYGIKYLLNADNESEIHRIKGGMWKASIMFFMIYAFLWMLYWVIEITGIGEIGEKGVGKALSNFDKISEEIKDPSSIDIGVINPNADGGGIDGGDSGVGKLDLDSFFK